LLYLIYKWILKTAAAAKIPRQKKDKASPWPDRLKVKNCPSQKTARSAATG